MNINFYFLNNFDFILRKWGIVGKSGEKWGWRI